MLERSTRTLIVTGFLVPLADDYAVAETDGPPGAAILGRALCRAGKAATLLTDSGCLPVVRAASDAVGGPSVRAATKAELPALLRDIDLLVYVERLGRAHDGAYYNMRGEDIGGLTEPLDEGVYLAREMGIPVLAVGDGGNEVGMGVHFDALRELLPSFSACLSVTPATLTLPVDVSNWGAYALAAMLSLGCGFWVGHDGVEEESMLRAMVAAGSVDGATKRRETTVDSYSLQTQGELLSSIREAWAQVSSLCAV